jgi:hypothetical protein
MEMPPLMKLVMARNRAAKGDVTKESDLLLPAYKIYEGDVRYSETPESNSFAQFLTDEFATYKGKFGLGFGFCPTLYMLNLPQRNCNSQNLEVFISKCKWYHVFWESRT